MQTPSADGRLRHVPRSRHRPRMRPIIGKPRRPAHRNSRLRLHRTRFDIATAPNRRRPHRTAIFFAEERSPNPSRTSACAINSAFAQSLVDYNDYTYFTAGTLEELAEKISVPADALTATVERYNELCARGVDEDFCKNPRFLYPIDEPPFYASKVGAVLLAVVGGAVINTDFQCLKQDGEPIEGLYAIGNTAGGTYAVDYPINIPGNSHGRALTQGYLCGRKLAGAE